MEADAAKLIGAGIACIGMGGAGVGVFVWLGLFGVGGGAFFQMRQNEIGAGSMNGAFQFFVTCALTILFLNQHEHEQKALADNSVHR